MSSEYLKEQVRRKLRVTWSDEDTDDRIDLDIIPAAEQELTDLLGIHTKDFDFGKPGTENMLFLNLCWYMWEGAADDFEKFYASQIARCREKWMVKQYVEEQEASSDV